MKIAVENVLVLEKARLSKAAIGNFALSHRDRSKMTDETHGLGKEELPVATADQIAALSHLHQQAQAFDRFKAIVLTVSGDVDIIAPAAAKLLDRYFEGEWLNAARLPDPLASWVRQQLQLQQFEIAGLSQIWQIEIDGKTLKIVLLCDFAAAQHLLICSEPASGVSPILHFQSIGLSKREAQVLALVAADQTNLQIAQQLVIEVKTVKKHLEHIFGKLGANDRDEAVRKALEQLDG